MDAFFQAKILESLAQGNVMDFFGWLAVFSLLWIQLRGLKNEFKGTKEALERMNVQFSKSLADGEKRFEHIEDVNKDFEHRLTILESKLV